MMMALAVSLRSLAAKAKGPIADKILFNAKSQEDLGLMDVATGKSDINEPAKYYPEESLGGRPRTKRAAWTRWP
jgi:hypothetical protein